jgi:hypothetical protein
LAAVPPKVWLGLSILQLAQAKGENDPNFALGVLGVAGSLTAMTRASSEAKVMSEAAVTSEARVGGASKSGPAATIPDNPGAFLERGAFDTTTEATYAVRAGPAGKYADHLFSSQAEAEAYASQLASTGEAAIRNTSALPRVWPGGGQGNPVDAIRVFEVPPNTAHIKGVVGPQIEGGAVYGSPLTYPGGGPQVVIDWNVKLNQVASYPVTQ